MQPSCFGPVSDRGGDALRSADLAAGLTSATGGLYHEQAEHHGSHRARGLGWVGQREEEKRELRPSTKAKGQCLFLQRESPS